MVDHQSLAVAVAVAVAVAETQFNDREFFLRLLPGQQKYGLTRQAL